MFLFVLQKMASRGPEGPEETPSLGILLTKSTGSNISASVHFLKAAAEVQGGLMHETM